MGAWIEMLDNRIILQDALVAPLVGAWIEICRFRSVGSGGLGSLPSWERGLKLRKLLKCKTAIWSLPSWERGLKSMDGNTAFFPKQVAPLVGAWIEINVRQFFRYYRDRRSPRGSVD